MATAVPLSSEHAVGIPPEPVSPPGPTGERSVVRPVVVVPPAPATPTKEEPPTHVVAEKEIRVYGHSNMFYWWPVWFTGFVVAALTYMDGHVLAVVPQGTQVETSQVLPGETRPRDVLVAPPGQTVPPLPKGNGLETSAGLRIATSNDYGVVFVGVLLLVIVVSNYIFRGLVSLVVIGGMTIIGLFFALMGWWDPILAWLGGMDIRMNAEGYLALSVPLFLIWAFTTFIYDHYTYIIVTRGQVRIRESIGDGEVAVDSSGLLLDKKRNDLFRHWLIGLGAGDLHIKTGGPANIDFQLSNVLFIGTKLTRIQNLLREKDVESTAA